MQFMMRLAPITFPIAMLAGLSWCIGIALLEQPYGDRKLTCKRFKAKR